MGVARFVSDLFCSCLTSQQSPSVEDESVCERCLLWCLMLSESSHASIPVRYKRESVYNSMSISSGSSKQDV